MAEDGGKLESRGRAALGREIETMARELGISRAALLGHLVQAWIAWAQGGRFSSSVELEVAAGWCAVAIGKGETGGALATLMDHHGMISQGEITDAVDRRLTQLFSDIVRLRRAHKRQAKGERITRVEVKASDPQPLAVELQQIPIRGPLPVAYVMSDFAEEMERMYPDIDIQRELTRARTWCVNNPKKQKTRTGVRRFLTSWMERSAERSANKREARE